MDDSDPLSPLLQSARKGDARALDRLLRRLWPWIRKKVAGYASRSSLQMGASSLAQETALRLSRSIEKVHAEDAPAVKALLSRIIKNTAISAHRSASRQMRSPVSFSLQDVPADLPEPILAAIDVSTAEPADDQLARAEHRQRILDRIAALPERQRQVLTLLLQGASYQEAADALGCTVGAVHMAVQRAKADLAKPNEETP